MTKVGRLEYIAPLFSKRSLAAEKELRTKIDLLKTLR